MLPVPTIPDARRQPRFKIEVDIRINSRSVVCGGYTVDINESGIATLRELTRPWRVWPGLRAPRVMCDSRCSEEIAGERVLQDWCPFGCDSTSIS